MKMDFKLSATTFSVFALILSATMLSSGPAQAQNVPSVADPARVDRALRTQTRPFIDTTPIIEVEEGPQSRRLQGDLSFTLKQVSFKGNEAFPEAVLLDVVKEYLNSKIALKDLNAMADKVTAFYRTEGYILSRAIVPPQRISSGEVTIQIIEGVVDAVEVNDPKGERFDLVQKMANRIRDSLPLNAGDLERYLLLIDDLPGVDARGVLQPSAATPGASKLVIMVDRDMVEGSLTVNNRGSRYLGPIQADATVDINNIMGLNERNRLRVITTSDNEELQFIEFRHEHQLGTNGTKLLAGVSATETEPGGNIEDLDVQGHSQGFIFGLEHPLIRSRRENLFWGFNFELTNTKTTILGTRLYEDRVRTLDVNIAYDFADRWSAVNRFDTTVTQGLSAFGVDKADSSRSRANADNVFTKLNMNYTRLQPIDGPWSMQFDAAGQWASDPLLASQEFGLGGPNMGVAYDPSEILGDHGAAAKLELQYNDSAEYQWLSDIQYFAFYDVGRVWNEKVLASESSVSSLASAGGGVRFNALEDLSGSIEFAVPLTRDVQAEGTDGNDTRVFFSLDYRF